MLSRSLLTIIIRRVHDRDEPTARQRSLHAVRGVTGDFRCADHPARVVVNRRHGQRDREEGPILPLPDGLEMRNRLSGSEACQHHVFFALPVGRDEHANGLADGLSGGVTEHAFGRPIPRRDGTVQILADDGVIRGLYDSGKVANCDIIRRLWHAVNTPQELGVET